MSCSPPLRMVLGMALLALVSFFQADARAAETGAASQVTLLLVGSSPEVLEQEGSGLSRVATVAKIERTRHPVLLLHGGDSLSTGLLSAFDLGAHVVDLLNKLEVDAMAVQPRELNYGADTLSIRAREASFPFVSSNLTLANGHLPEGVEPGVFLQAGTARIGVVSALPPNATDISGARGLQVADPVEALRERGRVLRARGARLVVGLIRRTGEDELDRRMEAEAELDVVVRVDRRGAPPVEVEGRTLIVSIAGNDARMAAVDVTLLPDGGWTHSVRLLEMKEFAPDPAMEARVNSYQSRLGGMIDLPVTTLQAAVDTRTEAVRTRENGFGNLVADAARAATGAEAALINAGQIRGSRLYPAGHVLTRGDVLRTLPFRNRVVSIEVTGAGLRAALEHGLAGIEMQSGRFPLVSGMQIVADMRRSAGARIIQLDVGGAPVVDSRIYRIAVTDFLAGGGDGYGMLAGMTPPEELPGEIISTVLTSMLRAAGSIAPKEDGRLTLLH